MFEFSWTRPAVLRIHFDEKKFSKRFFGRASPRPQANQNARRDRWDELTLLFVNLKLILANLLSDRNNYVLIY